MHTEKQIIYTLLEPQRRTVAKVPKLAVAKWSCMPRQMEQVRQTIIMSMLLDFGLTQSGIENYTQRNLRIFVELQYVGGSAEKSVSSEPCCVRGVCKPDPSQNQKSNNPLVRRKEKKDERS